MDGQTDRHMGRNTLDRGRRQDGSCAHREALGDPGMLALGIVSSREGMQQLLSTQKAGSGRVFQPGDFCTILSGQRPQGTLS